MKRNFSKLTVFLAVLTATGVFGSAIFAVAEEPEEDLSYLYDYEETADVQMDEETDPGSYPGSDDNSEDALVQEYFEEDMEDLGPGFEARSNIQLSRYLQDGSTGDDVRSVQERLAVFGYDVGPADGIFGPQTLAAVMQFQSDYGLFADGIFGDHSLEVINSIDDGIDDGNDDRNDGQMSGNSNNRVSSGNNGRLSNETNDITDDDDLDADYDSFYAPAYVYGRDLSYGSEGSDVTQIQQLLESLGYSVGGIDGVFGYYTQAAVERFQEDYGLFVDGVIGPMTAGQLGQFTSRASASQNTTRASQSVQEVSRTTASAPAATAAPAAPVASTAETQRQWLEGSVMEGAISFGGYLTPGMSGDDVQTLQQRLFDLGYLSFSPDGDFDSRTLDAVEAFQDDHGLYVDGVVGDQTLAALNWRHFLEEPVVSSLADSATISEKCYSREGNDVRFIIPHHMAGRMSGETCAQYFTYNDAGTSANYCIGYDGDIAQNIPEQYGAWTSGDVNFDRQAITIEVSDTSASDYTIPDAAQESLIDLCVDLVQRYPSLGGKLIYDPDDESRVIAAKNGTGSWDAIQGNVLLHRWTTTVGTTCPGWHMVEILPSLVEEVNNRLQALR